MLKRKVGFILKPKVAQIMHSWWRMLFWIEIEVIMKCPLKQSQAGQLQTKRRVFSFTTCDVSCVWNSFINWRPKEAAYTRTRQAWLVPTLESHASTDWSPHLRVMPALTGPHTWESCQHWLVPTVESHASTDWSPHLRVMPALTGPHSWESCQHWLVPTLESHASTDWSPHLRVMPALTGPHTWESCQHWLVPTLESHASTDWSPHLRVMPALTGPHTWESCQHWLVPTLESHASMSILGFTLLMVQV